jgi:uncharacterized protein
MEKKRRRSGSMKNSFLYECTVMHNRIEPKKNRFNYQTFMFSLDLDELDELVKTNPFISRNRFNLFNFRDRDHIQIDENKTVREQIHRYLDHHRIDSNALGRIQLITNLCTLGYHFSPVSFYFCFDKNDQPVCTVVEVCNTFGELKPYLLNGAALRNNRFDKQIKKNFYVSPFIDLDAEFHFKLSIPGESLNISINDKQNERTFFYSTMIGKRRALTPASTLLFALRFPFITLQVITLIHWQAFKLWMKQISWHKKTSDIGLQQGVLRPHKSLTQ